MDYANKSSDEIFDEFEKWPGEEFYAFFRHEALHYVTLIQGAAEVMERFLDEDTLDKDFHRTLLHDIQNHSAGLRSLLSARAEYDVKLHCSSSDKTQD